MIKDKLLKDIKAYCKLNQIEDVDGLINKMLTKGFVIEKYGETPGKTKKEDVKRINKYKITIREENEKVIEEIVVTKPEPIIEDKKPKDLYGE